MCPSLYVYIRYKWNEPTKAPGNPWDGKLHRDACISLGNQMVINKHNEIRYITESCHVTI